MKGGKIVGLAKDGSEVKLDDPSAVKGFDTNKYEEITLEEAKRRKTALGGRRTKKIRRPGKKTLRRRRSTRRR